LARDVNPIITHEHDGHRGRPAKGCTRLARSGDAVLVEQDEQLVGRTAGGPKPGEVSAVRRGATRRHRGSGMIGYDSLDQFEGQSADWHLPPRVGLVSVRPFLDEPRSSATVLCVRAGRPAGRAGVAAAPGQG
jgi:hypothetical protein